MSENIALNCLSEDAASSSMTTTTMIVDTHQSVFSSAPANPLLAPTQWSPWIFNPLLSFHAQQATYMLDVAGTGNPQSFLLSQLNKTGQIEHRSLPTIFIAGPPHMG